MDYLYLFKLFYNNIDSIIISLITGVITSLFITRIYFIKELEDDKVRRLKEHSEALYVIEGYFIMIMALSKDRDNETYLKSDILSPIKENISQECMSFSKMDFEDLDKSLHTIAERNNDLVEEMSLYTLKDEKIPLDKIKYWLEEIKTINKLYKIRYNKKTHNNIIYNNIFLDKFVLFVILLIVSCMIIA